MSLRCYKKRSQGDKNETFFRNQAIYAIQFGCFFCSYDQYMTGAYNSPNTIQKKIFFLKLINTTALKVI